MAKKTGIRAEVVDRLLAITAMFMLGAGSAQACSANLAPSQIAQAEALLDQNKSMDAFALMYPLSQQGSGGANQYLARMYEQGRGLKKSPFMVRHLNWMGAQDNDPESMYRTGKDFFERGYIKDGEHWVGRAKDCGHPEALVFLLERRISEERSQEAFQLMEAGVEKSFPAVKFILADQYDKGGLGLSKDPQLAFRWYYSAAKDGYAKAMAAVAYYFVQGIHGVQDELAARHWYFQAAKAGHVESLTAYAWMLANGKGGSKDIEEARYHFNQAAAKGDKNAVRFLAEYQAEKVLLVEGGRGAKPDNENARRIYQTPSSNIDDRAGVFLAKIK